MELIDYLKPTKYGDISNKSYFEAECGRFRSRHLTVIFYKGPMASGTSKPIDTPEQDWMYPPPDSMMESALKAVCNHTR